jgi:hypothetical protein
LGGLVLVPPVVHDPAHRRVRLVGHLDEVEAELSCSGQRVRQGFDAELVAVGTDEADLTSADAVVDPGFVGGCYRRSLLVNALLFSLCAGWIGVALLADAAAAAPKTNEADAGKPTPARRHADHTDRPVDGRIDPDAR